MNLDNSTKLSRKTISLHWLIAFTMIGLLASGVYMVENEDYSIYGIHKSIGVFIVIFALWRVIWRVRNGWPSTLGNPSPMMHGLAKAVHYLLIIGTVLLPLSGFVMSSMGGYGVAVFGLELVAANPDPANPQEMIAINGALAGFAHSLHQLAGNLLIAGVLLHLLGAIKHHLLDKDGTLRRMLGAELAS